MTWIGEILWVVISERIGTYPKKCGACDADRKLLNGMTPDQARAEKPALAARMAARWETLPRWWKMVAARTPQSALEAYCLGMIDEAIQRFEDQATPRT